VIERWPALDEPDHQRDPGGGDAASHQGWSAGEIYNATDDAPVTYLDYYTWCGKFLGQPLPAVWPP